LQREKTGARRPGQREFLSVAPPCPACTPSRRPSTTSASASGKGRQLPADCGKARGPPWQVTPAKYGNGGQSRLPVLVDGPGKARQRAAPAGKAGRRMGPVRWLATQSAPGTTRQRAAGPGRRPFPARVEESVLEHRAIVHAPVPGRRRFARARHAWPLRPRLGVGRERRFCRCTILDGPAEPAGMPRAQELRPRQRQALQKRFVG
jgi:hypothetical protein